MFGIPVSGTHAHSWVMSFPDELTAFRAYAESFPNNCVLLVDTYDVEQGVRNAITVGLEMREYMWPSTVRSNRPATSSVVV